VQCTKHILNKSRIGTLVDLQDGLTIQTGSLYIIGRDHSQESGYRNVKEQSEVVCTGMGHRIKVRK